MYFAFGGAFYATIVVSLHWASQSLAGRDLSLGVGIRKMSSNRTLILVAPLTDFSNEPDIVQVCFWSASRRIDADW